MALSMDEQRILDEIERGLASSDPVLATRMASFGQARANLTFRLRRGRVIASFATLAVVAVVSVLVYLLVPLRGATDRHAGGRASAAPTHPVVTAPSHPAATASASGAGKAAAPASVAPRAVHTQ